MDLHYVVKFIYTRGVPRGPAGEIATDRRSIGDK